MTELIFIEGLPTQTGRGGVLRLLIEVGKIDKVDVGKIDVNAGMATVEVVDHAGKLAAKRLDGRILENGSIRAWYQAGLDEMSPHFAQLLKWLQLEATAEQEKLRQDQTDSEISLRQLVLKTEDVGIGGRIVIGFGPRQTQQPLPWTRLDAGSPVIVRQHGVDNGLGWRGVVTQRRRTLIEVAFNQPIEPEGERPFFNIHLSNDETSRQRMQRAITQVATAQGNRTAELRDVILGDALPYFAHEPKLDTAVNDGLNQSQVEAVEFALAAQDVAIIHGPPGTGKTTTVVALIRAAIQRGQQILACAPSNQAVDNICTGLIASGTSIVRLGHPARVLPHLQAHTLDALVADHDDVKLAKKLRQDAMRLHSDASKWRRARPEKGEKQAIREEARAMVAEATQLESQAVEQILATTPVILSTLTGLDSTLIGARTFDLCVIDEAGQSTEPASWIAINRAEKVVLAGDHQQLPPTILSKQAEREGFGHSLLEQLMLREDVPIARRLDVQYRMNKAIMNFSSNQFYEGSLQADTSVAEHLLSDLPGVAKNELTETAVSYIDTAGASYDEEIEPDGTSRRNPQEADFLVQKIEQLLAAGVLPNQIGIITPYSAQVRYLDEKLDEAIEVNSVDGFQGREKEVILISLVRSNIKGDVGFLAETRRMNVALTRARRKLIVIGDSATITTHPFYADLVTYWESIGAYRSIWEELY